MALDTRHSTATRQELYDISDAAEALTTALSNLGTTPGGDADGRIINQATALKAAAIRIETWANEEAYLPPASNR